MDKLKVYGVECAKNGCNFYRIRQPFNKLAEKDYFLTASSSMLDNVDDQVLWTESADLIVTQAGTSEKFLEYIELNKNRQKFVFDYDDNIFHVSPYNPSYKVHGLKEVTVTLESGETMELWKDGLNGFNIVANQKRLFTFSQILKHVDMVTTPSPVLADIYHRNGVKNVKVLKNLIDFSIWNPLDIKKDNLVRIGYQGGWSHYEDFLEVKDALTKVLNKYDNVRLIFMGQFYEGCFKDVDRNKIQLEGWVSMETYPYKFKTLNIDIGIAPVTYNAFNRCKSEIKWEEYSALKIPCVASGFGAYVVNIDDGRTGFLAHSEEQWIESLSKLIESESLRIEIGENARKKVLENYDLDKEIVNYEQAYKGLFRPELILV